MGFDTVITEAFRGCGLDVEEVKASSRYRRIVRQMTTARENLPARSALTAADRVGHFRFGSLLNPLEKLNERRALAAARKCEPHPSAEADIEERALIAALGKSIVDAAIKYSLPRVFHKWAREWRSAKSAKQQLRIANRVCGYLHTKLKKFEIKSMHSDMLQQTAMRVLPKLYGRFSPRKEERPNCLGKAQLVAAFLRLCGAKTVAMMPLDSSYYTLNILYGEAARKVIDLLGPFVPPTNPEDLTLGDCYRMNFEFAAHKLRYERDKPSWPHLGIGVQLVSGRWAMLDPNFNDERRAPRAIMMPRIVSLLEKYRPVLPGLTVLHRHERLKELVDADSIEPIVENARKFHEIITTREAPWTFDEAVEVIEHSGFMDGFLLSTRNRILYEDLLRKRLRLKPKKKGEPFCRDKRDLATVILYCEYIDYAVRKKQLDASAASWNELKDAILGGGAAKVLQGETLQRAMRSLLPTLFNNALEYISLRWKSLRGSEDFHPRIEVGDTEYQLAMHTLSHVAVDMKLADPVMETLMHHGYSQFLLHNTATALVRFPSDWRCRNEFAQDAASHLAELPFRLRSTSFLLEELRHEEAA